MNIGVGEDIQISELVELIKEIVGFEGEIRYDTSKPDGTPRKLMDVTRLNNLGWKARISLKNGIIETYEAYRTQIGLSPNFAEINKPRILA